MKKSYDEYEFIARFYDKLSRRALRPIREGVIDLSCVKPGDSVLEVACGTGVQALLFEDEGAKVIGLDLSPYMLEQAKKAKSTVDFIEGDATDMSYEDGSFDIVSTALSLHEMPSSVRKDVLSEMIRVTRVGGKVVIADYTIPVDEYFGSNLCNELVRRIEEEIVRGEHGRNYSKFMQEGGLQGLVPLAENRGLKLEQLRPLYWGNLGILKLVKPS